MTAVALSCSQCGWAFDTDAFQTNTCRKCKSAILVTSVAYLEKFERPAIQKYIAQYSQALKSEPEDHDALLAIGICYLKLGLHDLSDRYLHKLIDAHPADPAGYYYRAISTLKGKRPRTVSLPTIREAEQLVGTALELDPANGRYEILLAVLRHDYYVLNGMRVPEPTPQDLLDSANTKHVDRLEAEQVFALLKLGDEQMANRFLS